MIEGGIKAGLGNAISEVGKIKIGGKGEKRKKRKGPGEYRLATKFGHFKVTTTERGDDGNFLPDEVVMAALGAEPKELSIRFPFDRVDMNFQTSYQYYDGSRLACEGNGKIANRKDAKGDITEIPCPLKECEHMQPDKDGNVKCKPSGRLSCYLPASPHRGGMYRFRTHGWSSVGGILAALQGYHEYTQGVLQGLPFKLVFTKKATEEHGNVPVVVLVLDGVELDQLRDRASKERQARIEYGRNTKFEEQEAKESGIMDDNDDPKDISEEFYGQDEDDQSDDSDEAADKAGASPEDVKAEMEAKQEDSQKEETAPEQKDGVDLF